jgi:disulfide bond formation protein DsbB
MHMNSFLPSLRTNISQNALLLIWLISASGVFGVLVAEFIFGEEPCSLCWWQRVALFPICILTTVIILVSKKGTGDVLKKYTPQLLLPFALFGLIASGFHILLYFGYIPHSLAPCGATGPSCEAPLPTLFGFLNLIVASFLSFATILGITLTLNKKI